MRIFLQKAFKASRHHSDVIAICIALLIYSPSPSSPCGMRPCKLRDRFRHKPRERKVTSSLLQQPCIENYLHMWSEGRFLLFYHDLSDFRSRNSQRNFHGWYVNVGVVNGALIWGFTKCRWISLELWFSTCHLPYAKLENDPTKGREWTWWIHRVLYKVEGWFIPSVLHCTNLGYGW